MILVAFGSGRSFAIISSREQNNHDLLKQDDKQIVAQDIPLLQMFAVQQFLKPPFLDTNPAMKPYPF